MTVCPLCQRNEVPGINPARYCASCSATLAKVSAIRDVAGLWNRAVLMDDAVMDAYDTISRYVPQEKRWSLVEAVEAHTEKARGLRRRASEIMAAHGITDDDMNDHYGSEAEKAVAHYDPTPMLPGRR